MRRGWDLRATILSRGIIACFQTPNFECLSKPNQLWINGTKYTINIHNPNITTSIQKFVTVFEWNYLFSRSVRAFNAFSTRITAKRKNPSHSFRPVVLVLSSTAFLNDRCQSLLIYSFIYPCRPSLIVSLRRRRGTSVKFFPSPSEWLTIKQFYRTQLWK